MKLNHREDYQVVNTRHTAWLYWVVVKWPQLADDPLALLGWRPGGLNWVAMEWLYMGGD